LKAADILKIELSFGGVIEFNTKKGVKNEG
jgi:hypothetical protein